MSSLSLVKIRRMARQKIVKLQSMLRTRGLTEEQKVELKTQVAECREKIDSMEIAVDHEEIERRRSFLASNPGLQDIFHALWMIFFPYSAQGVLTKEGYTKFYQSISVALVGRHGFEDLTATIDKDWAYDQKMFGELTQNNFCDFLFETIEVYSDIVNPSFFAAFAWALLDSIADTSLHPPKLRPLREIECITKMDSEAKVVAAYLRDKKIRAHVAITAQSLSRVPEVQLRLQGRRRARAMDDNHQKMVEAIANGISDTAAEEEEEDLEDEDAFSPSLENSATGEGEGGDAGLVRDFDDEDADDQHLGDSEGADQARDLAEGQPSFMDYIQTRRRSTLQLNGTLDRARSGTLRLGGPSALALGRYDAPHTSVPGSVAREPDGFAGHGQAVSKFAQFMMARGRDVPAEGSRAASRSDELGAAQWDAVGEEGVTSAAATVVKIKKAKIKPQAQTLADMQLEGRAMGPSPARPLAHDGRRRPSNPEESADFAAELLKAAHTTPAQGDREVYLNSPARTPLEPARRRSDKKRLDKPTAQPRTQSQGPEPEQLATKGGVPIAKVSSRAAVALPVASAAPYFMTHLKPPLPDTSALPKSPSDRGSRRPEPDSALSLSLSHVGDVGMSDYDFLVAAAHRNAQQRAQGFRSAGVTVDGPADAAADDAQAYQRSAAEQDRDELLSFAPTMVGVATTEEAYFVLPNVEREGFHDPFSMANVMAHKAALERRLAAQGHADLLRSRSLSQDADAEAPRAGLASASSDRFGELLPGRALPPLGAHAHGFLVRRLRSESAFTDDLSVGSSAQNSVRASREAGGARESAHDPFSGMRPSMFGSSLTGPLDLLHVTPLARAPPSPLRSPKGSRARSPPSALDSPGRRASAREAVRRREPSEAGHSAATNSVATRMAHSHTRSFQAPSLSPVVHPCHDSFLKVQGAQSSAEFRSQLALAQAGVLSGCNSAPWNARPVVEPFVSDRTDRVAGWRSKIAVLRAPPLLPVNRMTAAGKQQDTVKRAFLSFVEEQKRQERETTKQQRRLERDEATMLARAEAAWAEAERAAAAAAAAHVIPTAAAAPSRGISPTVSIDDSSHHGAGALCT